MTTFLRHHIPGWPSTLTLDHFILHMTTHLPALRRTLLLWDKEPEYREKSVPVFDLLLNPARSEELEQELKKVDDEAIETFQKMDFSNDKIKQIVLSVLWFTAQPCQKLLTFCTWKGQRVPCGKIFFPIPTDMGMCCTFNHNSLKTMLSGKTFANLIEGIEEKIRELEDVPDDNSDWDNFTGIDYTPNWGIQNGLTVIIDTKSELNPASVKQDFLGVQGSIQKPFLL